VLLGSGDDAEAALRGWSPAGSSLALPAPAAAPVEEADAARLERAQRPLLGDAIGLGSGAVISGLDDGRGLAPDEHGRIFERYYQAAAEAARPRPGSGLRLAIARGLVELPGGPLPVQGQPGAGATFPITGRPVGQRGASRKRSPMKILVVDDDNSILDALAVGFQLQWQDAEVIAASDGEAGLERFYQDEPDVVVLDVSLPGKSGFEVLREIRRISDVPVIMLTARGEELDQVRGLELGADDYVIKPFGHLALLARIKAVLRRAELPPPARAVPDFVAGGLTINFQNQSVTVDGEPVKLTPVEYRLLYHLVRNAGRLMPHQTLLDRVWGEEYGATTDYLKVFISRLRAKIERQGAPRCIQTERGLGYRFVRPEAPA
jgi:two-component system KDP operon response regulator KdpE